MTASSATPRRALAIVTCMDARVDPQRALGVEQGDAHVLRNAGAFVSQDILRSLVLSQRLLGTRAVAVIAHTECGLRSLREDELASALGTETGERPPFTFGSFEDVDEHVVRQVETVRGCPWLPHAEDVRGYVLDVTDGSLREVVVR
ncbi:MAG: beta-class carbonic anhydrase [Candidatus Dormibacteria bacterium]